MSSSRITTPVLTPNSYRAMGAVVIKNNTSRVIHVRVTAYKDNGQEYFMEIQPEASEKWDRANWQVAFALRDDNGKTETFVVKPNNTYLVV